MARFGSIEELHGFREMLRDNPQGKRPRIVVCAGTACQASSSSDIIRIAKKHIIEENLFDRISIGITGCHGFCEMGPFVLTLPQNAFYAQVKLEDVPRIIGAVLAGAYVEDLLYRDPKTGEVYRSRDDIPFFKNQRRSILGLNQHVDPIRINDYVAAMGYQALELALGRKDPAWVVGQVKRSGLRGRGGAGFLTGAKWELLARANGSSGKYLVCNADEGDPGAYMDRSILEGNPHSIIEGMTIGAYGTGATEGVVYVRNEYPLAIKHLTIALRQARDMGLLGENILGTGFSFDVSVVRGAGAFVCGEETALMRSIEGRTGEPRQRPPFPIEKGINGRPTSINNVETWANVPFIFRQGADEFARVGTPGNSGTKIFSLVGKIRNTGLVEVPMGVTIRRIVYDIGGGPSGKARIKAVQTGGPSGGCIPAEKFDLAIDYDSLAKAGSIMGSGGMIVMDENTCMVDVARYYMNFLRKESCGKCFTCRKGTQRMYELLDDITKGRGRLEDLDLLKELAVAVKESTMCGLGQTAANPVLSTLKYFRHEYERHIVDKRCDALVCKELTGAACQRTCPLGTEAWRYVAHIRRGEYDQAYRVIREANPFPSVCARVCNHPCESRCKAGDGGNQPVAIRALKRFVVDRVDPSVYKASKAAKSTPPPPRVAIVGAGPAGLAAAHYLSLQGYPSTVFESEDRPGGMLWGGIPEYRLPRETLRKEIDAVVDGNVTLECKKRLGVDMTIGGLFAEGFKAVFLALGAHKSRRLGLEGEDVAGVHPSMQFLKAYNLRGESLAQGHVGVVGGGNSAVDAARLALRQKGVKSVTIFYRRTREEMPAFEEEIEEALHEGVRLEVLVAPTRILSKSGKLTGVELLKNELGPLDASGRRAPVPVAGSEHVVELDTLIVGIGEEPTVECVTGENGTSVGLVDGNRVKTDCRTMSTSMPGVFAGGDVETGPKTVVDAIAAGKKAAAIIGRYLRGEALEQPAVPALPRIYVEPMPSGDGDAMDLPRVVPATLKVEARRSCMAEVEGVVSETDAVREASRCLRCDLEFTQPKPAAVKESA
ncbi:MAG: NADH-ubiquinone oxidoreductase-F iron-sulfur binding region domain-containing protein [Deltaproteobacteria bacterium]|nr:NADH-ubiquinone oxidoreductase-F iron-sulfur binding region domain-containing protein [Deltaproteobacteria bacterium]